MSEEQQIDSTEDIVRQFLRDNPAFLDDNPDILESLSLPHNSGKAVSLVERQVGVMRDRNKEMRNRLDNMLATAHDNDLLFEPKIYRPWWKPFMTAWAKILKLISTA